LKQILINAEYSVWVLFLESFSCSVLRYFFPTSYTLPVLLLKQFYETFKDGSARLENLFAAFGNDELCNKMVSYMMDHKVMLIIKTF
jgi:hypothetical protein